MEKEIIVIWRNKIKGFDSKRDKDFVENELIKEEYDEIFINGNSLIADAKSNDEILKKRLYREL